VKKERAQRKLRILVLTHPTLVPPDDRDGHSDKEYAEWKTEYDVVTTLRGLGHEVRPLGVADELQPIRAAVDEWKPHIAFNLIEEFHGLREFDQHVVAFLELLRVPYTGCNPNGLVLARSKALSKKLLNYHRLPTPAFAVFPRGEKGRLRRGLKFPLIVKGLNQEASEGISQASIVESEEKLAERVRFIHERHVADAIVEQFIEGREIYVSLFGRKRLTVLPVWELTFDKIPEGAIPIATEKVKHDVAFQEKWGIHQKKAELAPELERQFERVSKRAYRILELDGYARIDYRLSPDGHLYFIEANPNPEIAKEDEFASAADAKGIAYPDLLQQLVNLGLARGRSSAI
jgi:D-alanine-D-alanine ligase